MPSNTHQQIYIPTLYIGYFNQYNRYRHKAFWYKDSFAFETCQQLEYISYTTEERRKKCIKTLLFNNTRRIFKSDTALFEPPMYREVYCAIYQQPFYFDWTNVILNEVILGPKNRPVRSKPEHFYGNEHYEYTNMDFFKSILRLDTSTPKPNMHHIDRKLKKIIQSDLVDMDQVECSPDFPKNFPYYQVNIHGNVENHVKTY